MQIKEAVKKIPFVKLLFNSFFKHVNYPLETINLGIYTTFRTLKYFRLKNNIQSWKASMRVSCHIIEKGLTMPEKRLGFGQDRILLVANEILTHEDYKDFHEFTIAVGLIKEYKKLHEKFDYTLPIRLHSIIDSVTKLYPNIKNLTQIKVSKDDFFSSKESSFPSFARSRHSVRNFSDSVSLKQINDSIQLSLTAPSACNRQAIKCHIFSEKEMVQKILSHQNGNRGFGYLIPQLCILTMDLRMIGKNEQNDIYFNTGLFAMNLCYAFHYNMVGNCMLNWSVSPKIDKALKKITEIPKWESVAVIIAIGAVNDEIEIAKSTKMELEDAVVYH